MSVAKAQSVEAIACGPKSAAELRLGTNSSATSRRCSSSSRPHVEEDEVEQKEVVVMEEVVGVVVVVVGVPSMQSSTSYPGRG